MNKTELKGILRMVQIMLSILCFAAVVLYMLPIGRGILHIGMIYPSVIFLILGLSLAFPKVISKLFSGPLKPVAITAVILLGIFVASILSTIGVMAAKAVNRPSDDADMTVVVLGCQVLGKSPSRMLNDRIKTAYDYLDKNKNAKCVASGGQGDNEKITEAECIKNELVKRGIDESRIFIEDKSESTAQNLEYSAKIIAENGLSKNVAVASDNFHQLRAAIFAKNNGLTAFSLGCPTAWYLTAGYWTREVLGVVRAVVRGY